MKKLTAIVLTGLLMFNVLGFFGLWQGLRYKNTMDMVHRLDSRAYTEDETILLKIHVSVPYMMYSEDYERVDGEFEHNGELYRLVKQKYQNDTLFMVCIKDYTGKRIERALEDYVKTFTDNPIDAKQNQKTTINFIKDYLPSEISICSVSQGWDFDVMFAAIRFDLLDRAVQIISPPPRG